MEERELFKYCPRCSGELQKKEEYLLCPKCDFEMFVNPVPCNAVIIEDAQGAILMVKRKYDPKAGYWDLPGGFIDTGENFDESCKREIKEELGTDIELQGIKGTFSDTYLYKGLLYHTICIVAKALIKGGEPTAKDDVETFMYFKKEEIPDQEIAFEGIKRALRDYLKQ